MTNIEHIKKKYLEDPDITYSTRASLKKIFNGLTGLPLGNLSIFCDVELIIEIRTFDGFIE